MAPLKDGFYSGGGGGGGGHSHDEEDDHLTACRRSHSHDEEDERLFKKLTPLAVPSPMSHDGTRTTNGGRL